MFTLHFTCPQCRLVFPFQIQQTTHSVSCPHCTTDIGFPVIRHGESCWFVVRKDQHEKEGPFSLAQLRELVATKQLVLKPGSIGEAQWQTVHATLPPPDQPAPEPAPLVSEATRRTIEQDILSGNTTVADERFANGKSNLVRPPFTVDPADLDIVRKLGSGGMGAVYLARQISKKRLVALKILDKHLISSEPCVARFYREALALESLNHPNIVGFYGLGRDKKAPFFVMELIEGLSTAKVVSTRGKLAVKDALHVILKCAEGLDHALSRKIVHRDIKPENIMLTNLGGVKIADLGLAKSLENDPGLTESGITLGSPRFMAPEQARNAKHADHRSDLFALGGVLYFLVTGTYPFPGETAMEIMLAKEKGQFPSARQLNSEVPPCLDVMIDKLLARDPRHRHGSYAHLIHDLGNLGMAGEHLSFNVWHLQK